LQLRNPKSKLINIQGGCSSGEIEHADPVTNPQVAVIWVDEDGLPPEITDKTVAFKIRPGGSINLDFIYL
jgi:hypothetical protein